MLLDTLEQHGGIDFGREIIPASLGQYRVSSYLFRGYWADVGTRIGDAARLVNKAGVQEADASATSSGTG